MNEEKEKREGNTKGMIINAIKRMTKFSSK